MEHYTGKSSTLPVRYTIGSPPGSSRQTMNRCYANMSEEFKFKDRAFLVGSALFAGFFLILRGLEIVTPGNSARNAPNWIFFAAGIAFTVAGITVMVRNAGRWNALSATVISLVLGSIFGWVSLFADDSGVSGSVAFLSFLSGIPFHRILFGIGVVICGLVSYFAFRSFLRDSG